MPTPEKAVRSKNTFGASSAAGSAFAEGFLRAKSQPPPNWSDSGGSFASGGSKAPAAAEGEPAVSSSSILREALRSALRDGVWSGGGVTGAAAGLRSSSSSGAACLSARGRPAPAPAASAPRVGRREGSARTLPDDEESVARPLPPRLGPLPTLLPREVDSSSSSSESPRRLNAAAAPALLKGKVESFRPPRRRPQATQRQREAEKPPRFSGRGFSDEWPAVSEISVSSTAPHSLQPALSPWGSAGAFSSLTGPKCLSTSLNGSTVGAWTLPSWPVTDSPSAEDSSVRGLAAAVCDVVQGLLQLKYGLPLDTADFVRKAERHCSACGGGSAVNGAPAAVSGRRGGPVSAAAAAAELASQLNTHPELRFQSLKASIPVFSLRLEWRSVASFAELRREVQLMLGTPRAVATVRVNGEGSASLSVATGGTAATGAGSVSGGVSSHAAAVLREDYAQPGRLVARAAGHGAPALLAFHDSALMDAVILDPHVVAVYDRSGGAAGVAATAPCGHTLLQSDGGPPPPLRTEYVRLGVWLVPDAPVAAGRAATARAPAPPMELPTGHHAAFQASAAAGSRREAAGGAEVGSAAWMKRIRAALAAPKQAPSSEDRGPVVVTDPATAEALLSQLTHWLGAVSGGADAHSRAPFVDEKLPATLVSVLRRASAPLARSRGEVQVATQACHVMGLAAEASREAASAFVAAGAVPAIVDLMRFWLANGDAQIGSAFALRRLLEAKLHGTAQRQLPHDAVGIVAASLAAHPGLPQLQRDGMQLQRLLDEEWEDEVQTPLQSRHQPASVATAPPFVVTQPLLQPRLPQGRRGNFVANSGGDVGNAFTQYGPAMATSAARAPIPPDGDLESPGLPSARGWGNGFSTSPGREGADGAAAWGSTASAALQSGLDAGGAAAPTIYGSNGGASSGRSNQTAPVCLSDTSASVLVGAGGAEEDADMSPKRKDMAAKLMEKRAADAAKPGFLGAAVDWLMAGAGSLAAAAGVSGTSATPGAGSGGGTPGGSSSSVGSIGTSPKGGAHVRQDSVGRGALPPPPVPVPGGQTLGSPVALSTVPRLDLGGLTFGSGDSHLTSAATSFGRSASPTKFTGRPSPQMTSPASVYVEACGDAPSTPPAARLHRSLVA